MKKQLLAAALSAAIFSVGVAHAGDKMEKKEEREKCYGVAKAAKNDCAAKDGSSSCAGQAKTDANPNDWVYVPKGLCEKLVGGVKGESK
ncbi:MAG: DUF2282 domain-containing protein [Alphaproteobacteria bacterium]